MIDEAITALRDGRFILLYDFDDREGETDFAIRSDAVTPRHILQMRKDGGGLIVGSPPARGTASRISRLPVMSCRAPTLPSRPVTSPMTARTIPRSLSGPTIPTRLRVSPTGTGHSRLRQLPNRSESPSMAAAQISMPISGPPDTVPSSGQPTDCLTSAKDRRNFPSHLQTWLVSPHRLPFARCLTMIRRCTFKSSHAQRMKQPAGLCRRQ